MTLTDRTRTVVDERLTRIQQNYETFRVFGETVSLPSAEFAEYRDRAERGFVGGCYTCVMDGGRMLFVDTAEGLSVPSGPARPAETLEAAAQRHVREQSGVDAAVVDLFQLRQIQLVEKGDPDGPTLHALWAVFDGAPVGGAAVHPSVEGAVWREEPPGSAHPATQSRLDAWSMGHNGSEGTALR